MTQRTPVIEVMDDAIAVILRSKTEVERLQMGFQMFETARKIMRAAIQSENPTWDEGQVNKELARRISGGLVTDVE